jgi:hypothetical protein
VKSREERLAEKRVEERLAKERLVEKRRGEQARIERRFGPLTAKNSATVDFLYAEAKETYATGAERIKVLEGKAGTLIGIVTTGFGFITLIGDPTKVVSKSTPVIVALAALALAFVAALGALFPRRIEFPDLSSYALRDTVANPSNGPRIKFDLIEPLLDAGSRNVDIARSKAYLLIAATVLVGLGLLALGVNFMTAKAPGALTPTIRVITATEPPASPIAAPIRSR